jgi:hypothetical protein
MGSSSMPPAASKVIQTNNKDPIETVITIIEKVNLTKQQHQVLKIICDIYQMSFSEYMQQALVEAMRFDIEEGNLCDALLENIGGDDSGKDNCTPSSSTGPLAPDLMKSDIDLPKKLQTQMS